MELECGCSEYMYILWEWFLDNFFFPVQCVSSLVIHQEEKKENYIIRQFVEKMARRMNKNYKFDSGDCWFMHLNYGTLKFSCLHRDAISLQCFPPTRYVSRRGRAHICAWRPLPDLLNTAIYGACFIVWLYSICSTMHVATTLSPTMWWYLDDFFCLVCRLTCKKKKLNVWSIWKLSGHLFIWAHRLMFLDFLFTPLNQRYDH